MSRSLRVASPVLLDAVAGFRAVIARMASAATLEIMLAELDVKRAALEAKRVAEEKRVAVKRAAQEAKRAPEAKRAVAQEVKRAAQEAKAGPGAAPTARTGAAPTAQPDAVPSSDSAATSIEAASSLERLGPEPVQAELAARNPAGVPASKRRAWSREEVVDYLVQSIVAGSMPDAAFVKRHAPPGFVSSTLRCFGRLDVALNLAALQVAKLYPRGRPEKRIAALRGRR